MYNISPKTPNENTKTLRKVVVIQHSLLYSYHSHLDKLNIMQKVARINSNVHYVNLYFTYAEKVKSDGSPAYTIYYDPGAGITQLDIDLVPSFKVEGWSDVARRINPRWILADDKVNDSMKCYDVVCKACPVLSK